jgi:hypothetical protein
MLPGLVHCVNNEMKKVIRRVKPPQNTLRWHVDFRLTTIGVCFDISLAVPKEGMVYTLHKTSYLIPMEQIRTWAKGQNEIKR